MNSNSQLRQVVKTYEYEHKIGPFTILRADQYTCIITVIRNISLRLLAKRDIRNVVVVAIPPSVAESN